MPESDKRTGVLRRVAGIFLLLIGLAGVALSAAGIAASWWVQPKLTGFTADMGKRVDTVLAVTVESLDQASVILANARQGLDELHKAAREGPPPEAKPQGLQKFLITKLSKEFTPQLDEGRRILEAALNGAVVVNSVLEGMDQVPLTQLTNLDTEQLKELSGEVKGAAATAFKLNAFLNNELPGNPTTSEEAAQQTMELKETLLQIEAEVAALRTKAIETRDRVTRLRTDLPGWITAAAVAVTVFLCWFGLGQLCLIKRGWSWLCGNAA